MPTNRALWQDKPGDQLVIRETPYPTELAPDRLLVRVRAWALNPCDWAASTKGLPFIKYPSILGEDVAGEVVAVGTTAAGKFKPGDRVTFLSRGTSASDEEGAFQDYVVARMNFTSLIPDFISFAEGSVFPLTISTPFVGLFSTDFLGLPYPSLDPTPTGKSILVWGGSSSVGSNAIQLAKASGYDVITTGSPQNFEYLKELGATTVFDYSSPTVVSDLIAELDRSHAAGIFQAAGVNSAVEACLEIAQKAQGDLFVATSWFVSEDKVPAGVRVKMVYGSTSIFEAIADTIFGQFLPNALAARKYRPAPKPLIVETKGLEGIEEGLRRVNKGVSAEKVVVVSD